MSKDQKNNSIQVVSKIINFFIYGLCFLMPLYFLPWTVNVFDLNKQVLLIIVSLILFSLWSLKMLLEKKISIRKSPFDLPLFLFFIFFVASTLLSKHKTASLFGSTGPIHWNLVEMGAFYLLYLVIANNIKGKEEIKKMIFSLLSSVFLGSLVMLLSYFNLVEFKFLSGLIFSPFGYPIINSSIVIIISLILSLGFFKETPKTKKITKLGFLALFYFVLGLTFLLSSPLTGKILSKVTKIDYPTENRLEGKASWNIAVDTFQAFPLLGGGPSTFRFYFDLYRPNYLNNTSDWQLAFQKPSNEYFSLLAETGALGLLSFIYLFLTVFIILIKRIGQKSSLLDKILAGSLFTLFLIFLLTASTVMSAFLLFILLGINATVTQKTQKTQDLKLNLSIEEKNSENNIISITNNTEVLSSILLVLSLILTLFIGFFTIKFMIADIYYYKTLKAYESSDGEKTYLYIRKAIEYNKYKDDYHNTYAQIALLLATNLSQKEEPSQTEIQNIQSLLNEATQEVKITTEILSPQSAYNWQIRGDVYRELIGVAEEASNWTISAYQNAIDLNPQSPSLRLAMGQIYLQVKDYEKASQSFSNAITLKKDYANAYYNLAQVYEINGDNQNAYLMMKEVLNLIPKDEPDYEEVKKKLEMLEALLPEENQESTESVEVQEGL